MHALRYTAASLTLREGIHRRVAPEVLGHATIKVTLGTYSPVLPATLREVAGKLAALFLSRMRKAEVSGGSAGTTMSARQ